MENLISGDLSIIPSNDEEKVMSFGGAQMWEEGGGALGIGGHSRPGLPVPIDPRREGGASLPAAKVSIATVPDPNAGPFPSEYASQFQKRVVICTC